MFLLRVLMRTPLHPGTCSRAFGVWSQESACDAGDRDEGRRPCCGMQLLIGAAMGTHASWGFSSFVDIHRGVARVLLSQR